MSLKTTSNQSPSPSFKLKPSATIQDKNLIESLLYLKENNLIQKSKSAIKFETINEAEDAKKEDVVYVIREKLNAAKQDISELQKAGYNMHLEGIRLIEIPLKEKIWLSTLTRKDLENIFKIINEVNIKIIPLKKENEQKIAEKERIEKISNQKEREANQQKESTKTSKTS